MKAVADQVFTLWRSWVNSKSGRQRRYHEFYRTKIINNRALEHVSFEQTLEILMEKEPLRLWPMIPVHQATFTPLGN
ncbi:MAG: hypothetical protein ACI9UU_002949 [Candidatus Azotimanducaceae bacterium]|jgi:hypothetical protein